MCLVSKRVFASIFLNTYRVHLFPQFACFEVLLFSSPQSRDEFHYLFCCTISLLFHTRNALSLSLPPLSFNVAQIILLWNVHTCRLIAHLPLCLYERGLIVFMPVVEMNSLKQFKLKLSTHTLHFWDHFLFRRFLLFLCYHSLNYLPVLIRSVTPPNLLSLPTSLPLSFLVKFHKVCSAKPTWSPVFSLLSLHLSAQVFYLLFDLFDLFYLSKVTQIL